MLIDSNAIILKKAEKGFNLRKVASLVNVVFFWGIAMYLMRSLLALFGWLIMYLVFGTAFADDGFEGMVRTITFFYFPLILLAAAAMWGWAVYNRYRYGGKRDKRRVQPDPLALDQVREYTGLPMAKLEEMRNAKIMVCHFNERKEVKDVDCRNIDMDVEVEVTFQYRAM